MCSQCASYISFALMNSYACPGKKHHREPSALMIYNLVRSLHLIVDHIKYSGLVRIYYPLMCME